MQQRLKKVFDALLSHVLPGLGTILVFTQPTAPNVSVHTTTTSAPGKSGVGIIVTPVNSVRAVKIKKIVVSAAQLASNEYRSNGIRLQSVTDFVEDRDDGYGYETTVAITDTTFKFRAPRHKMFSYTESMGGGLEQGRFKNARGHYYPDLFRVNQRGDLASLNLRPVMKEGRVVLVRLKRDGAVVFDSNVNEELYRLCENADRDLGSKMWVDHIEGNVVFVRSLAWAEAEYFLQVKVETDGRLQILSYRTKLERDSDPVLGLEVGPEDRRYE